MKEYQKTKNNPYWIPQNLYMMTVYFIRSYYEMKQAYDNIIDSSPANDGQPKGTGIGDPTEAKAEKLEYLFDDITIIEKALKSIPEEYQPLIWENVVHRVPMKMLYTTKTPQTLSLYRGKFIHKVAELKKII